jgi:hypothetical protein
VQYTPLQALATTQLSHFVEEIHSRSFKKTHRVFLVNNTISGWWDGSVLGSKARGWFPSNFCTKLVDAGLTGGEKGNDSPLPRFWGKKQTKEGQVYYFNSNTNQTTFELAQVMKQLV